MKRSTAVNRLRQFSRFFLTLPLLSTVFCMDSEASSFDGRPKILLHVQGVVAKNPCSAVVLADCADAVTEGDLVSGNSNFHYVYLLSGKGNLANVSVIQFAIAYQANLPANAIDGVGIDIFSWTICSSYELVTPSPFLPQPLSGSLIIWDDDCQVGDVAVAGYFYLGAYSPDVLQVIPRQVDNAAKIGTCAMDENLLDETDLGSAAFSSGAVVPGCNPCDGPCPTGVPVQPSTWSGVKSQVR